MDAVSNASESTIHVTDPIPCGKEQPTQSTADRDIEKVWSTSPSTPTHIGGFEVRVATPRAQADDQPPDGGYGWVVILCIFMQNGSYASYLSLDTGADRLRSGNMGVSSTTACVWYDITDYNGTDSHPRLEFS